MKYLISNFKNTERKTKKIKLKQDKKRLEITAVKSLIDDENAIAYTSLKKVNADDENIVSTENGMTFRVSKKRKFYHEVVGYVPAARVTAPNAIDTVEGEYIGLLKFNFVLLLIPLLLALILCLAFCGQGNEPTPPDADNTWNPIIDQNIGTDETDTTPQQNAIQMNGFSQWAVPAGKTENLKISLTNPKGNPCYFSFEIYLKENDELIYKSDLVPPGEAIKRISISRSLTPGTYDAYLHIVPQELETGKLMNDVVLDFQLITK